MSSTYELPGGGRILATPEFIALKYPGAVLIPDPPVQSAYKPRRITKLAFENRFTTEEAIFLELAQLDNPAAPMEERQQAAMLRVFFRKANQATFIDLDREDTQLGVQQVCQLFEANGLVDDGEERAQEILFDPIEPHEVYVR